MSTPDSVDLGEASQREDLATTSKGLNIVLAMHCEPGHSNASFGLAKRLRDRGHKVTYLGLMDARRTVTEQGFEFVSFAEDILPEGATRNSGEPPGGLRM